ncbi:MAG: DALR domain-containing protein, partial [Pseudomonadota bacterium]
RALGAGIEPTPSAASAVADALGDDLNTPLAIAALHERAREGDVVGLVSGAALLGFLEPAIGGWEKVSLSRELVKLIDEVLQKRNKLRSNKKYKESDIIRDKLKDLGFSIVDGVVLDGSEARPWIGTDDNNSVLNQAFNSDFYARELVRRVVEIHKEWVGE